MLIQTKNFIEILKKNGWEITLREPNEPLSLNETIKRRFKEMPLDYIDFISNIESCLNEDGKVGFWTDIDFSGKSDSAFKWNEFESMSLEAVGKYPELKKEVIDFWEKHLPIMLSVKADYAYIALEFKDNKFCKVVYGIEPEFEEVTVLCNSFSEFQEMFSQYIIKPKEFNVMLNDFI